MLPSPATERRKSRNLAPRRHLTRAKPSAIWYARARVNPLIQRKGRRTARAAPRNRHLNPSTSAKVLQRHRGHDTW